MSEKTENLRLSDKQKTRLLSLGLERAGSADKPDADEERGDLLCDVLRCPLPRDENLSSMKQESLATFSAGLGPSVAQLLSDRETNTIVLRRIKDYAKVLGKDAKSDGERDVFLAIYFAAIAGALVAHGEWITEHTERDLTRFFNDFAQAVWMRVDLRNLFAEAVKQVESKGESGNTVGS